MARIILLALAIAGCTTLASRADTIHNIGTGLYYAGFDIIGEPNPLSGGADLLITQQFSGQVYDFGSAELTLQGPISLGISTGGRILPVFEVSLATAVNSQSESSPLSFSHVTDIGPQARSVSGSTLIDADFSINALGFYDFSLTYSTRRTVQKEGAVNASETFDSDVGPLAVSGNIFVDALELLTDPFFEQTGQVNPLSSLSKSLIDLQDFDLVGLLAMSESDLQELVGMQSESGVLHSPLARTAGQGFATGMVVPEPPVLVLLLVGLPIMIYRGMRPR